MLKQSNATRETLQTVFAVTDRVMTWPRVMDMWQGSSRPEGLALGWGLAIMVCLITCTATQQVISQTGTLGLTCHREINNPPTRSGYLRGSGNGKVRPGQCNKMSDAFFKDGQICVREWTEFWFTVTLEIWRINCTMILSRNKALIWKWLKLWDFSPDYHLCVEWQPWWIWN